MYKLNMLHAWATGVYLSHNGTFLEPGSTVFITDIGTSSHQQLVCTTDRMPRCQYPNQNGYWFFPNWTPVNIGALNGESETFYSSRDNNAGSISLLHSGNFTHLQTGNFCCGIQDAMGTYRELCVIIGENVVHNKN